ncbi:aminotransferase class I/II-fold pyridoxal phosphate-dependent enzyme [Mesorhizobium sp. LHD-90]|uniref:aminotransferase class I/II-fold pyridoxal phosphate-dependent enzyme n=1 Tax=Mesorhizobium sp. LHD-90 TaxID=3071414 RepID=UPI0027E02CA1|nr:aminotransferase class I/II-fold pyridoxal phosphate-dependent enzyme [Mesorhizobium sp. LHD-90]MDQ6436934.1 aminotransferase class I/II-fold pyridoxal phosphate-dependent enzyme [Mesorhizobium sp. LHD-90]
MNLPPFLLDHWLAAHEFATPSIRYNLAASTGPKWSVDELLALGGGASIGNVKIGYAPPEGGTRLREAIGGFLGVDPDWVVVTTGASEALLILLCLAARPGANVVLPAPAFSPFAVMAEAWGLGVRAYTLSRDDGFCQRAGAVVGAADARTVLALVNTPHNPAGSVMPRDEIRTLAENFAERGVPLIVDEVYHPLYFGRQSPTAADIPNAIVMGDMSKALSLAGLRLGWLVIADAALRKRAVDARGYFTISSSPILEELAVHALTNHQVLLERLSAVASANLSALTDFMERVSHIVSWARPEGGTVAFPWFNDRRDSRPFCQALAAQGVLIAPGDCFGMPAHFRIGFAAQAEGFEDALAIFEQVLRQPTAP